MCFLLFYVLPRGGLFYYIYRYQCVPYYFQSLGGIDIVACQRGGVSDEPPWLRAATRQRARDPLGPLTGGRNLTKYLDRANLVINY